MPLEMKILCDKEFHEYARRYSTEAPIIMGATLSALILGLQKTAMKTARGRLMEQVYTAPLPDSARADPAFYLEVKRRRSGAVFKAINKSEIIRLDAHTYTGSVYVDKPTELAGIDEKGTPYYYAIILDRGGMGGKYRERPFWRVTEREMAVLVRTMSPKAMSYIKGKLKGSATGGSGIFEVV